jgi:hypothetical protein
VPCNQSSRTITSQFIMPTEIFTETLHYTAYCLRSFSVFSRLQKRQPDFVIHRGKDNHEWRMRKVGEVGGHNLFVPKHSHNNAITVGVTYSQGAKEYST